MQRQRNVAAEKPRFMLIVQSNLKDIVCILLECVFAPRQQPLLVHADNNLIGRFALIQCFDYLLQGDLSIATKGCLSLLAMDPTQRSISLW